MATVRPIPKSYYYSGQGRLGIGDRDATTGELKNVVFVGNVTSLTVDIATTKFEHKESMSGDRAIDLTIVQEKNATFKFTAESLSLTLLAAGLYGTSTANAGATVASEIHLNAKKGTAIPLKFPNVSAVVVTTGASPGYATAMVEGVDYAVDEGFGTIYLLAGGAVFTDGGGIKVAYTYGAFDQIDAFTQGTPPEKYIRFEGLNTVNGDLRLIDIPRASLDPLTGLEFINEELGSGEFNGNILPDLTVTNPALSKYFRERRIYAVV